MGETKFIKSIMIAFAVAAGAQASAQTPSADDAPLTRDEQIFVHQVQGQIPLTIKDGKVIPEQDAIDPAIRAITGEDPTPLQRKQIAKAFAENAAVIAPVSVALPQNPRNGKSFLMIDPFEIGRGLPLYSRVNDYSKWFAAKQMIEAAGGEVIVKRGADADNGARETYTRDRYTMIDGRAYLPDVGGLETMVRERGGVPNAGLMEQYKAEIDQAEEVLKSRNIPTHRVAGAWFEGGNIISDKKSATIFMGLEPDRDNAHSLDKLIRAVTANGSAYQGMGVPLVNQVIYYHLDLGMSEPLPKGAEVLLSPYVTDDATFKAIQTRIGKDRVIKLGENEDVGVTNLVAPTETAIVMTKIASPELLQNIRQRGYTVIDPSSVKMMDLTIAAGGVHCMTNDLPRKPQKP